MHCNWFCLTCRRSTAALPPGTAGYTAADADEAFAASPHGGHPQQRQPRAAPASAHHHHTTHQYQQQQQEDEQDAYGTYSRGAAAYGGDAPPAYVQELRSQVASLQQAVESQLRASMPYGNTSGYGMQPGLSPSNSFGPHGAHVGGAAAPQLPAELAGDPEMRRVHAQHVKDMTVLKYEVERARNVAELEQLRASLADLKTQGAGVCACRAVCLSYVIQLEGCRNLHAVHGACTSQPAAVTMSPAHVPHGRCFMQHASSVATAVTVMMLRALLKIALRSSCPAALISSTLQYHMPH